MKTKSTIKPREWEKKIRDICTYYSEFGEGTAGYSLSGPQFKALFSLIANEIEDKAYQKGFTEALERVKKEVIGEDDKNVFEKDQSYRGGKGNDY